MAFEFEDFFEKKKLKFHVFLQISNSNYWRCKNENFNFQKKFRGKEKSGKIIILRFFSGVQYHDSEKCIWQIQSMQQPPKKRPLRPPKPANSDVPLYPPNWNKRPILAVDVISNPILLRKWTENPEDSRLIDKLQLHSKFKKSFYI